jgi:uncharacterized membrane protein YeaQ/YmgE (transglycosylase-associated protein family)
MFASEPGGEGSVRRPLLGAVIVGVVGAIFGASVGSYTLKGFWKHLAVGASVGAFAGVAAGWFTAHIFDAFAKEPGLLLKVHQRAGIVGGLVTGVIAGAVSSVVRYRMQGAN